MEYEPKYEIDKSLIVAMDNSRSMEPGFVNKDDDILNYYEVNQTQARIHEEMQEDLLEKLGEVDK